mmetsp:Transcript_44411/g.79648  ORF Transcript_44411/g.79648 Transcript_44411/m.79648 type:complete len:88 (-) Transcript_44411:58-321(-)
MPPRTLGTSPGTLLSPAVPWEGLRGEGVTETLWQRFVSDGGRPAGPEGPSWGPTPHGGIHAGPEGQKGMGLGTATGKDNPRYPGDHP